MFGKRKKSLHARPTRRSSRGRGSWSSSVVGTHASDQRGGRSRRAATHRRPSQRIDGHAGEINQIHFQSRSVDERTAARSQRDRSRTATFMKRRDRMRYGVIAGVVVLVLVVAFGLGTCAFRNSVSSSMALDDANVSGALVPATNDQPFYVLLSGISNTDPEGPTASYVAVMRIDASSKTISLLNIPSSIAQSYDNASDSSNMLRDAPHASNEGDLVSKVSALIEQDINHYMRISDEDFVSLVDSLGGLHVTVDTYVDDPTVGNIVLDPGEQTLSGEQALMYVSAKNYTDEFGTRSNVQNKVIFALIDAIQAKGGISFAMNADNVAGKIKTDMDYDTLNAIASLYSEATIHMSTVPGSKSISGDDVFWSVNSSTFSQIRDEFKAGEDMDITVDTSGVNRGSVSIIVLNGAGTDGYSAQAAQVLTDAGYAIQETGNAESFVYDETLVIYREEKDKLAAESIVQALGTGRAVSAGVYYSLKTDIQVVVGKDWTSHV